MATFAKLDTRRKIVEVARSYVSSAHYLWGTVGNIPDVPNARFRKVCKLLKNNTNSNAATGNNGGCFAINTAYSDIQTDFSAGRTGFNTCAGGKGTVPAKQVLIHDPVGAVRFRERRSRRVRTRSRMVWK
jgi:hypothetical protein